MSKSKPPPWIPPGTNTRKIIKPIRPATSKNVEPSSPKVLPKKAVNIPQEGPSIAKDVEPDVMSISSNSSVAGPNEPDIHLISIYQDMKLLYIHFESLRASYLSTHRLIDLKSIEDSNIKELFTSTGNCIKELNTIFGDLEYSVSVLENTLEENQKVLEYSNVLKIKGKLLSELLDMCQKIIVIFQTVFEQQDFKEVSQLNESLNTKLKLSEKKTISQEAVIKDLERKLSIHQSKSNAFESYKANLESAKAELEKQLQFKEARIRYLSNELLNSSGKQTKTDHEEFIEVIQAIKSKAHADKSALKKALKHQRAQTEKKEEKCQKLMQELDEKEKMMFDLAGQRDQLKIQLTVFNNNIIQQKNQIEELKIQHQKLQNEVQEKDLSHKKEITELKHSLEEKAMELKQLMKTKTNLEKNIEELESDLQKSKEHLKNLKEEKQKMTSVNSHKSKEPEELSSLFQSTKKMFESFKETFLNVSASGDHNISNVEYNSIKNEILAAVAENNEHLLELKKMYKAFLQEQKETSRQKPHQKKNDLEKQLNKLDELYNAALVENQELKQEIEKLRNSNVSSPSVQKTENYFTTNMSGDNLKRKLQLDLIKKNEEIVQLTYDFKLKERDLENQLREHKDKLRTMEVDSMKISRLEDELKSTKLELSILQKKKEEETERLLQRTKDLQDSLDLKSAECESMQRHKQLLVSSYFNTFGDS